MFDGEHPSFLNSLPPFFLSGHVSLCSWNSQQSNWLCICFLTAGIRDIHHHSWHEQISKAKHFFLLQTWDSPFKSLFQIRWCLSRTWIAHAWHQENSPGSLISGCWWRCVSVSMGKKQEYSREYSRAMEHSRTMIRSIAETSVKCISKYSQKEGPLLSLHGTPSWWGVTAHHNRQGTLQRSALCNVCESHSQTLKIFSSECLFLRLPLLWQPLECLPIRPSVSPWGILSFLPQE